MKILIDNAGFVNKGAELMLRAVIQSAKERFEKSQLAITQSAVSGQFNQPIGEGLLIYRDTTVMNFVPKDFQKRLYSTGSADIDYYLDAGGFQFSDQWLGVYSEEKNQKFEAFLKKLQKQNTKIVFLSQAFGPFAEKLSQQRIKIAFKYADLIFAREGKSYKYLNELLGDSDKIILRPDFTNLLKPNLPLGQMIEENKYIAIVPNKRMITDTKKEISDKYLSFMTNITQGIIDKGHKVVLLNHEGIGDEELILRIKEQLTGHSPIVLTNLNALEVKMVISKVKLLISSRFHGVVSGLSQGISTFATGWSHKYIELLKDYDVKDNLLNVNHSNESIDKILFALSEQGKKLHTPTKEIIEKNQKESKLMWDAVWSLKA